MATNHLNEIIVEHLAGSRSYGTSTPTSDTDYRGIFMADKEFIITPFHNVREQTDTSREDAKFYELNNYLELYLDANPNIMETLWVAPEHITRSTEIYEMLRAERANLLSSKLAFTYTGFAHNQTTRMKNHHSWIDKERRALERLQAIIDACPCKQTLNWIENEFPEYVPGLLNLDGCDEMVRGIMLYDHHFRHHDIQMLSTRPLGQYHFVKMVHNYFPFQVLDRDFNIMNYNDGYELMPYGHNIYGLVARQGGKCINKDGSIHKVDTSNRTLEQIKQIPNMIIKFNKDEYEKSAENRKNYHTWKSERNEARAELELAYGFDTKHAMHVVRLLRTAEEALTTGVINVNRPDAEELLAIRNGAWSYEQMMDFWNEKDAYIRGECYKNTVLPNKPNRKLATKLLIDMREAQWYGKQG